MELKDTIIKLFGWFPFANFERVMSALVIFILFILPIIITYGFQNNEEAIFWGISIFLAGIIIVFVYLLLSVFILPYVRYYQIKINVNKFSKLSFTTYSEKEISTARIYLNNIKILLPITTSEFKFNNQYRKEEINVRKEILEIIKDVKFCLIFGIHRDTDQMLVASNFINFFNGLIRLNPDNEFYYYQSKSLLKNNEFIEQIKIIRTKIERNLTPNFKDHLKNIFNLGFSFALENQKTIVPFVLVIFSIINHYVFRIFNNDLFNIVIFFVGLLTLFPFIKQTTIDILNSILGIINPNKPN